jgi:excisionase family DNA binding protein
MSNMPQDQGTTPSRREGLIVNTMLTTRQVAERLVVHEETVLRAIRRGELTAYKASRKSGY